MRDQRINELHRRLSNGRRVVIKDFADEFEVVEKTIRRDFDFMLKKGFPIKLDPEGRRLYFDGKAVELSASIISSEDRFALHIGRQAAEQFRGTPWYEKLVSAYTRMLDTLHRELRTDYQSIAAKIRFDGMPQSPVPPAVWNVLRDCLEINETMNMVYRSGESGRRQERRLDPYGLIVRNREWYVVGWDHSRRILRTFFLPRIESAESADERFTVTDGFDLDAYLATSVDAHQSNRPACKVKLRFTEVASSAGENFIWNNSQTARRDGRGRWVVEFVTGALFAVERHVLSWAGGVEVLSPPELKASVRAAAQAIVRFADSGS